VINITHVLDPPSGADVSAYRASRAAVSALTRTLAAELPSPMIAVELDPGVLLGLLSETEAWCPLRLVPA
jgi:NAD(P)-dependent dehydrogenase (short-subunit alcohol dehydrogenase family)